VRYRDARVRGGTRARHASAVIDARYDRDGDAFVLVFRSGGSMTVPRRFIPGLEGQPASALESVAVSPAGDALLWPSLDADVYVPGLVERAFGDRVFAAAAGARRAGDRVKPLLDSSRIIARM
jgi:Protein of unknown function (DUF2442)